MAGSASTGKRRTLTCKNIKNVLDNDSPGNITLQEINIE
jgi:hypothetical protein